MAYDKIISVSHRLDHCMSYILDPTKNTAGQCHLAAAINCDLKTAYEDMMRTKARWGKTGGVLGYHLIHSYAPGEVTAREAHEAGVEFAGRLLGQRYEAVVSTHTDRAHVHCHILFNSVSFMDGRKYQNTFRDYFGDIRETSNAVSRERGLSIIAPRGRGAHYAAWSAGQQKRPTLRTLVQRDVDTAIDRAFTMKSFWAELERMGYAVKHGRNVKYAAVRPAGSSRFLRLTRLGDGYTEEAIQRRITEKRTMDAPPQPKTPRRKTRYAVRGSIPRSQRCLRGFQALYVRYLCLLRGQRPRTPFPVRAEVVRLRQYTEQFYFLRAQRIHTAGQLSMLEDALQAEIDDLTARRTALYRQKRRGADVSAEIEQINQALRPVRKKLRLCGRIEEDIPRIQAQLRGCGIPQRETSKHHERRPGPWR